MNRIDRGLLTTALLLGGCIVPPEPTDDSSIDDGGSGGASDGALDDDSALDGESGHGDDTAGEADDGDEWPWPDIEVPEPVGEALPMTCEWLDGDNCFTELMAQARSCVPDEVGLMAEDGRSCEYLDGSSVSFSGAMSEPAEGSVLHITEFQTFDPGGEPCFTRRYRLALYGWESITVGNETAVVRGEAWNTMRLICPDGTHYTNTAEGSCPDFGLRWLRGSVPRVAVWSDTEPVPALHIDGGLVEPDIEPEVDIVVCEY